MKSMIRGSWFAAWIQIERRISPGKLEKIVKMVSLEDFSSLLGDIVEVLETLLDD